MKDLSEDVVHSFPGFEKLLEPFKITGDAKVKKDLVTPKNAPHYSANSKASDIDSKEPVMAKAYEPSKGKQKKNKKARKKLKESINNFRSNTMKSQKNKFDELFENVMGEEDLDMTLGTDGAGDMEMDADLNGGMEDIGAGAHGDLHQKIENIISALTELKASLAGEEAAEGEDEFGGEGDEGEEDLSDADEDAMEEEGMHTPEEAIVSEPEPKLHNTQPAVNAMTGKSNKPNSKLTKPGQELFQV